MSKRLLILAFLSTGYVATAQSEQKIEISINRRQMNAFETMKPVKSFVLINDSIVVPADEMLNDSLVFTDVNFDKATKQLTFTQHSVTGTEQSLFYTVSGVSTENTKASIAEGEEEPLRLKAFSTMSCTNHTPSHTCPLKDMKRFSDAGCVF